MDSSDGHRLVGKSNMKILVHDIRQASLGQPIEEQMKQLLNPVGNGMKKLPTLLLYDEEGLKIYEELTYLEEYYLLAAEVDILTNSSAALTEEVQPGSIILELGSGNLRKVKILLDAFECAKKQVFYYALDLSLPELHRTLRAIEGQYNYVHCAGLLGTYEDGLSWLQAGDHAATQKCVLWLGSSIGNYERAEAVDFLRTLTRALRPEDALVIGLDACQDRTKVLLAYNDPSGITHRFILNGLSHANRLLGEDVFDIKRWHVVGHYDAEKSRHQAFLCSDTDLVTADFSISAGEKVQIEESNKYSLHQSHDLWTAAGLTADKVHSNADNTYHLHVLRKAWAPFETKPEDYAPGPTPSILEFEQLWLAWDKVAQQMLPKEELFSKPIKLRNACIFYLGHMPAFLDIHLTRATGESATSPAAYHALFERGIDPDVDNPEQCHAHSEIPDEWPPVEDILSYQERVRERVRSSMNSEGFHDDRKLGRALWLAFEHEAMHLETFLYMLLQSDKSLPPDNVFPDFESLALRGRNRGPVDHWVQVPAATFDIGIADEENDEGPTRYFGWDNEKPRRQISVKSFESRPKPLTNGEYATFLHETKRSKIPASWTSLDFPEKSAHSGPAKDTSDSTNGHSSITFADFIGGKFIRTFYGPVSLRLALDWPVVASYDELAPCANYYGGRIPNAEEVESIYHHAVKLKSNEADNGILARKISAVNGHLSNNGVEISPPKGALTTDANGVGQLDPRDLFVDLEGCNTGFRYFHPVPVSLFDTQLSGRGELGGVWELTSTILKPHEGFRPSQLYPGYTADFFDGKHNVVLGGSWATHPRIAGRKSFVNWYQHNYEYAFTGARVVRTTQVSDST